DEVEERHPEVFGRGVVDVRHQPLGVFLLDDPVQPLEVTLDLAAAKPARHQRGDLVTERITQERRVTRAGADPVADQRLDARRAGRTSSARRGGDTLTARGPSGLSWVDPPG